MKRDIVDWVLFIGAMVLPAAFLFLLAIGSPVLEVLGGMLPHWLGNLAVVLSAGISVWSLSTRKDARKRPVRRTLLLTAIVLGEFGIFSGLLSG